ncbi:hypothetical protein HNQ56_002422 [Anaerotaenia torta]|uniref:Ig-like domain-containing protein n=1 Tax=Anaerotaenia torta TaxID=433293 RepID=UPI003D22AB3F
MKKCRGTKEGALRRFLGKCVVISISLLIIFQLLYEHSSVFYRVNNVFRRRATVNAHLNENDLYLLKGEEFHLYVIALNQRVSFSSTNFWVAGVNFNGRVFGYQTGHCFILAKVDDQILKCRVHVMDISKEKLNLKVGGTHRLRIHGSNSFVRWKSSNPEVATVNMFGKVKAKKRGRTVISAKIKGKTLQCEVRVK